MARYIEFQNSGAAPKEGKILVNSDKILSVVATAADAVVVYMSGGTGSDIGTLTTSPSGNANAQGVRDAINYALTANPGGVKAKVQLPSGVTITDWVVA